MSASHVVERGDSKVGYWTRAQIMKMDRKALARMIVCHPKLCPPRIREAIRRLAPNIPVAAGVTAETVLSDFFSEDLPSSDEEELTPLQVERMYVETAKAIRRTIAARHGLTMTDLDSDCRASKLAKARHEAMYLICKETTLSYPRIGRMFGGRDHTTVLHGIHKHADRNGLPRVREPDESRERNRTVARA